MPRPTARRMRQGSVIAVQSAISKQSLQKLIQKIHAASNNY